MHDGDVNSMRNQGTMQDNNNSQLYAFEVEDRDYRAGSDISGYTNSSKMNDDSSFAQTISKKHTKVTSNDYCKFDYFGQQRHSHKSANLSINELIRQELKLKNFFITLIKLTALFSLITLYNELYLYRFDLVSMMKKNKFFKIYPHETN